MKVIRRILGCAGNVRSLILLSLALALAFLAMPQITVRAQKAADSKDMKLVGYSDLQAAAPISRPSKSRATVTSPTSAITPGRS